MKMLDYLEEGLLVVGLMLMVGINFGNVLSRYVIHASWAFSEELMVYIFVYNSFIGAAVAFKRNAHLGVTILTDRLPVPAKKGAIVLSMLLTVGLMVVLTYYGLLMVENQMMFNQKTPSLGMPEWIGGMAVPFGAVLIIIRVLQHTWLELRALGNKENVGLQRQGASLK
jgi:C4-dicarboxylate transporter, DctQ subunit